MRKAPHKPSKTIEVIAGPDGSGKSTFAESYFLQKQRLAQFINPDTIAAGLSPLNVEKASFQAGRVMIMSIKEAIKRIKKRVTQGGHFIPPETVRRRYPKTFHNFGRFIVRCAKIGLSSTTLGENQSSSKTKLDLSSLMRTNRKSLLRYF